MYKRQQPVLPDFDETLLAAEFFTEASSSGYSFGAMKTYAINPLDARKSDYFNTNGREKLNWLFTPNRLRNRFGLADSVSEEVAAQAAVILSAEAIVRSIEGLDSASLTPDAIRYLARNGSKLPAFLAAAREVNRVQRRNTPSAGEQLADELDDATRSIPESIGAAILGGMLGKLRTAHYDSQLAAGLRADIARLRNEFWRYALRQPSALQPSGNVQPLDLEFFADFENAAAPHAISIRNNSGVDLESVLFVIQIRTNRGLVLTGSVFSNWPAGEYQVLRLADKLPRIKAVKHRASSPIGVVLADSSGKFLAQTLSLRPGVRFMSVPPGFFKKKRTAAERLANLQQKPLGRFCLDPIPPIVTEKEVLAGLRKLIRQDTAALSRTRRAIGTEFKNVRSNRQLLSDEEANQLEENEANYLARKLPASLGNLSVLVSARAAGEPETSVAYLLKEEPTYDVLASRAQVKEFLEVAIASVEADRPDLGKKLETYKGRLARLAALEPLPACPSARNTRKAGSSTAIRLRGLAEKYIEKSVLRLQKLEKDTLKMIDTASTPEEQTALSEELLAFRVGESFPEWCEEKELRYLRANIQEFEESLNKLAGEGDEDLKRKARQIFLYSLGPIRHNLELDAELVGDK